MANLSYTLITVARNEERYIEKTIQSVIAQTILPKVWIIVSDGSTDRTDEIVKKYLRDHPWIELVRMPEHKERSFAAKANCFNTAYEKMKYMGFDVIGNIDADVSFDAYYIEFLLGKFLQMPGLGVAGTPYIEEDYNSIIDSFGGASHVSGPCQLFRRKCFEDITGYARVKDGIDWIAVTTARMKGWETRSFRDKTFIHYRKMGTGEGNRIKAIFKYGTKDYTLGAHPLWVALKIVYRIKSKPYVIGSIVFLSGYLWALFRIERPISKELIKFVREEQMKKLKSIVNLLLKFNKIDKFTPGI